MIKRITIIVVLFLACVPFIKCIYIVHNVEYNGVGLFSRNFYAANEAAFAYNNIMSTTYRNIQNILQTVFYYYMAYPHLVNCVLIKLPLALTMSIGFK